MLARLTGSLESLASNSALLAPDGAPGIAYEVLLPAYLAERLGGVAGAAEARGQTLTLHTLQYLESQNQGASFIPRLLGFASAHEREFFELLTSVKGLGNKRALRAMALEPHAIARAIAERDARFLQTLPEIGPKLAELIVHELRGKVDRFLLSARVIDSLNAASAGRPPTSAAGAGVGGAVSAVEAKPGKPRKAGAGNGSGSTVASATSPRTAAPPAALPPIRATVAALISLGEAPIDAERMVARALDAARAADRDPPATAEALLSAAYAARSF